MNGQEVTDDLVRRLEVERCHLTPRLTPEDAQRAQERRIALAIEINDRTYLASEGGTT